MNFFKRSNTPKPITCPRCLGKGHVDWNDIKRLGQELRWNPGKCAYCNGAGKVASDTTSKVPVDEAYLTTDLPNAERVRLIDGDESALKRAGFANQNFDLLIQQIKELHFVKNLDAEQIAELYLGSVEEWDERDKNELLEYINRVIVHSKGGNIQ